MENDINGDEAMENLNRLTDKIFKVKRDDVAEIAEDEPDDNTSEPTEDE